MVPTIFCAYGQGSNQSAGPRSWKKHAGRLSAVTLWLLPPHAGTQLIVGSIITATWSGIAVPASRDWIGLYVPGSANTAFIDWIYVSCSKKNGSAQASGSCPFILPAWLAPGTYELRLFTNDGYTRLTTSNSFTVSLAPGMVSLSANPRSIGTMTATWSGITVPASRDWIGLYVPGSANTAFIDWIYVSCTKKKGSAQASGSCPFILPALLAHGTYELRLLANDGYARLATSRAFTVTSP